MNNPYVIVGVVTVLVVQSLNVLLMVREAKASWRSFLRPSGAVELLPAVVASLLVTSLLEPRGTFNYPLMVASGLLVGLLVWAVQNRQKQRMRTLSGIDRPQKRQRGLALLETITPSSMAIGVAAGALTAVFLLYHRIAERTGGLFVTPERTEHEVYAGIFAVWSVIGLLLIIVVARGGVRRLPTGKALRKSFRRSFVIPGFLGIGLFFVQRAGIQYLDQRIVVWLLIGWIYASLIYYAVNLYDGISLRIVKDKQELQQEKQLERRKRRSKRTKRRK